MRTFFFIFATCLTIAGCHDTITTLKGCCDEPAINVSVGLGNVFVPNVFTPNGDQVNDMFVIYGDSMRLILSMKIKNADNEVVYNNLHLPFNDPRVGWDGTFAGKITRGMYTYEIEVESIDRTVKTIKGKICNCPCDQESDADLDPIHGCEFSVCPPDWIDCDPNEYLPCFEY